MFLVDAVQSMWGWGCTSVSSLWNWGCGSVCGGADWLWNDTVCASWYYLFPNNNCGC